MLVKFDSSVCRICLQSKATYSIFENEYAAENFAFVTLLEISESDSLPSYLCEQCYLALRVAAYVRRRAIASNNELKLYLKRINETFLTLPSRTKSIDDDSISDINVKELAMVYPEINNTKDNNYKITEVIIEDKFENDDDSLKPNINPLVDTEDVKDTIKINFDDLNDDDEEYGDIEELIEEASTSDCDEVQRDVCKLLKFKKIVPKREPESKKKHVEENKIKIVTKEDLDDFFKSHRNTLEDETINGNTEEDNSDRNDNKKYKRRRYIPDIIKVSAVLNESEPLPNNKNSIGIINDTFRCGECDNTFTTKLNLDRHMEIHLNRRKSYSCEICGKLFTQLNSVREHSITHTGEKPFKCEICNKAFSRRQIYKRHLSTHSKVKKYGCKLCDQKFTVKRTLILHSNRVHGNGSAIEHKCQICFKSYRSKYTLSDHLQNVHNVTL